MTAYLNQSGVTSNQPNISVRLEILSCGVIFKPVRVYKNKTKPLDNFGKFFTNTETATDFAIARGYLAPYFKRGEHK